MPDQDPVTITPHSDACGRPSSGRGSISEPHSCAGRSKVYFAADAHFGLRLYEDPICSQRRFVRWLCLIEHDCRALYLLGDIFDYWFEYNHVVPKGFTRVLGKLAQMTDDGIEVCLFPGNHDLWLGSYLKQECGVRIMPDLWRGQILGHNFCLSHGDGLGDPSLGFRFLRAFFRNRVCQWLYKWIHPDLTMPFGLGWSSFNRSRRGREVSLGHSLGPEREFQVLFAKDDALRHPETEFYIFGHRHIQLLEPVPGAADKRVVILGEWMQKFTYAVFDGSSLQLLNFADKV